MADTRKGDRGYFDALYQAIDGAELPAFLDYLLGLDLSAFDFRNPPHTTALNAQKLAGGDSLTQFWLDCLNNGEIVGTGQSDWPDDIVAHVLHRAYVGHAHDHGDRNPLTAHHMAKKLAKLMPGKILRRIRPLKPHGMNQRPTRYVLENLNATRAAFLEAMGIDSYTWPG